MSAILDISTIGTPNNQIVFNDFNAKPIFKVQNTMPTRRDIREQDAPIPGGSGVADYQTIEGKLYWIIEGVMYPYGEAEYYQGREMLRKLASLEVQQADPFSDGGYVPYTWQEAGTYKQIFLKVEYVDGLGENSANGTGKQPFKFFAKIKNPFILNRDAVTTTLNVNTVGTPVGSSGYPLKFPVLYGLTSYAGGNGSVTNTGSIGAYPSILITGPVNVPRITNLTTGEYLEVNINLPTVSDVLTIFYDADTPPTVTWNGVSQYNKVSSGSTFFKIKPGTNNLALTAATLGATSVGTVSFYPTYPLS